MGFLKTILLVTATAAVSILATRWYLKESGSNTKDDTSFCMDYANAPQSELTSAVVKAMIEKYKHTQLSNITNPASGSVPNDAQAIWFDLETLKKFIYHVERNTAKVYAEQENAETPALGLRIYYAAYPNQDQSNTETFRRDVNFSMRAGYENLHTLVMIPTIADHDGNNIDFNPIDSKTYKGYDKMAADDYGLVLCLPGTQPVGNATNMGARNHGMLYPPGAPGGAIFY